MRILLRGGTVGAVIAAVAVIAACGDDPQQSPSTNPVGPGPSASPAAPFVASVEIRGPASIAPGESAQFSAISHFSDGTTRTADNVRWASSASLLQVEASGLATAAQQTGEALLYAQVTTNVSGGWIRSSKEVLILPDGTYRMVGLVTENGAPTATVDGARVEVSGAASLVAMTDYDGRYRLYGVPANANIRVTRDGYQPHIENVRLTEHTTRNFALTLAGARLEIAGPYTLTIDVRCTTSTPVPADVRQLSYAALLTQTGPTVEVLLTEFARFRINSAGRGNRFSGHVDAAGATFHLDDFLTDSVWYYALPYQPSAYPSVVEQLSGDTILIVSGTAVTRRSPDGLSGDLAGGVSHFDSRFISVPLLTSIRGSCFASSPAHRFTLTRR